jgi:multidrug efflux pump subunit AcrB
MKNEIKNGDGHQELLDSTIKENWLARVGVHKPYTVFVCIMAILILGVFAVTTLKTELFPNMNLPYAIVVMSPDQDRLTADYSMKKYFTEEHSPLLLPADFEGPAGTTEQMIKQMLESVTGKPMTETELTLLRATVTLNNNEIIAITTGIGDYYGAMTPEERTAFLGAKLTEWMGELGIAYSGYLSAKLNELAPANVTAKLSTDMQSSLEQVSGKKQLQSMSMTGVSIIIMEYQSGVTVDKATLLLAIENANLLDKPEVYGIKYSKTIMQIDPSMMPVYSFTVSGKTNDWYQKTLIPRLKSTAGVGDLSSKFDSQTSTDRSWLGHGGAEFTETVSFTIQRSTDVATTDAVKNITAALTDLGLEKDKDYIEVLNQGKYITSTIGSVGENLIIGGILAILILFLFLRSVKMTLAIAISIPLAVIATFVAMYFAGIGLNIVSMSALALAVGMLVDNSVVVLENIFRLRQKGESIRDSAIRGASQIMAAMVASTLTTICVFFPMFFLTGLIMEVFMDLVWVIIFSLSCSLLVAVMFLPAIISSFHIEQKVKKENAKAPNGFKQFFIKVGSNVKKAYDKALNFSISKKWGAVGIALLLFVGSIALLFIHGFVLMPSTDEGEFSATVSIIPSESRNIDKEELSKDVYDVIRGKLADDLETCMVEYTSGNSVMSVMSGGAGGDSISISVKLKDKREISTDYAAQTVAGALQDLITQKQDYKYYGKLEGEVTYSSSNMTGGMVAENVTVVLAVSTDYEPEAANAKLGALNQKVLDTLDKTKILGVYSTKSGWSPTTIIQVDKRVVAQYTMKINDGAKIADVQSAVDKAVDELLKTADFKDIETHNDGFAEQMQETYTSLGIAIGVGLILVYLVMVMVFQSFLMPLIVLICIPLAFTGAFILLAICGMPLSIPALIGFLILMGIIVNNGILAVDYTNQARRDGLNVRDALVAAMHTRMRPIFMTALTTIIGLLPMAFNWSIFGDSMGGAMMQPLAVVAIGGLLFGTLTTLLVVPAFYAIFVKDKHIVSKAAAIAESANDGGESEFVRIRGKKVNKAKKAEKRHIDESVLLEDGQ